MAATKYALSFDPEKRPLGCNGKYGGSGISAHRRKGTKPCKKCRDSYNHYRRDMRRGGRGTPFKVAPCGTYPAAQRHKHRGEPLDFACKLARAEYAREWRAAQREAKAA